MRRPLRHAAAAALVSTALITSAATATAAPADPVPTFDFADCPATPAGADPGTWRCEELKSSGVTTFGSVHDQPTGPLRMTFAEGESGGQYAQVFGALRAEPTPVAGGLFGTPSANPLLRMDMRIEYAGYADFLSVGDQMGEQHLKIRLLSPLLPATCTIGSDQDPLVLKPLRTSGPDVISTDPPVLRFTIADQAFAMPKARGCGPFDHLVNRRLGLPSPAGTNSITLTTTVGLKYY